MGTNLIGALWVLHFLYTDDRGPDEDRQPEAEQQVPVQPGELVTQEQLYLVAHEDER